MGAHHDGTGAQSAYGLSERMSETDVRKGQSLDRDSDLDESKKKDCIRKGTPHHWLSSSVRRPVASPSQDRELPPVEAKAGRSAYACRIDIRVKTKSDSDLQKEAYGASLTTLFSASRQMSAIVQNSAGGNRDVGRWPL
jgi:hypothetical protein